MASLYSLKEARSLRLFEGACVAFGVFDGLHCGHRHLIDGMLERARACNAASVILTFDRDPDELFAADSLRKLMSNDVRLAALADCGADSVVALEFTPEFAALSPEDFLAQTFGDMTPASLHVGVDFHFGSKGSGDVECLRAWSATSGCEIAACPLLDIDGAPVTATRIRKALAEGDVVAAARLLGRPWRMEGTVVKGRGEGADLGFATANLELPATRQLVAEGVYGAYAYVDGVRYKAAVSVGKAPMFAEATATCEVHILDFSGDIYGDLIYVDFVAWLRPMMTFASVDELVATVMGNISWVRENL